jgi:hypothetical protein
MLFIRLFDSPLIVYSITIIQQEPLSHQYEQTKHTILIIGGRRRVVLALLQERLDIRNTIFVDESICKIDCLILREADSQGKIMHVMIGSDSLNETVFYMHDAYTSRTEGIELSVVKCRRFFANNKIAHANLVHVESKEVRLHVLGNQFLALFTKTSRG